MIDDYAGIINGVMWTQVVLGVIFVALRLYTRVFLIQSIGWDDLLMIVNLVCCISSIFPSQHLWSGAPR